MPIPRHKEMRLIRGCQSHHEFLLIIALLHFVPGGGSTISGDLIKDTTPTKEAAKDYFGSSRFCDQETSGGIFGCHKPTNPLYVGVNGYVPSTRRRSKSGDLGAVWTRSNSDLSTSTASSAPKSNGSSICGWGRCWSGYYRYSGGYIPQSPTDSGVIVPSSPSPRKLVVDNLGAARPESDSNPSTLKESLVPGSLLSDSKGSASSSNHNSYDPTSPRSIETVLPSNPSKSTVEVPGAISSKGDSKRSMSTHSWGSGRILSRSQSFSSCGGFWLNWKTNRCDNVRTTEWDHRKPACWVLQSHREIIHDSRDDEACDDEKSSMKGASETWVINLMKKIRRAVAQPTGSTTAVKIQTPDECLGEEDNPGFRWRDDRIGMYGKMLYFTLRL